ncbi:cytochrome P450 protein [Rutstroemia sp. NJR-2017a WRK4]|nr:cytochrome P450 protein [Rutstroemia sp. NJR-2017a WRK4]
MSLAAQINVVSISIPKPAQIAALLGLVTLASYSFLKLYQARMLVRQLQRSVLPVAPCHSFFLGNLLYLKDCIDKIPYKAHYFYAFGDIYRSNFQNEGVFYLDMWPVAGLMLVVISPSVATEAFQNNPLISMRKLDMLAKYFKPIAGRPNLFDMQEADWRPWRTAFNKGFSTEYLTTLVPGMVMTCAQYCETLRLLARDGEMFQLDSVTLRFTLDLIGRTILNADLGAQKGYNQTAEFNPLEYINFVRSFIQWRNVRRMNQYIGKQLDKRHTEFREDSSGQRSKVVIDLVLQAYLKDQGLQSGKLDPRFRDFATRQIRLFLFAGHDSTSSTICFCIYHLYRNPEALQRVREEHDRIFATLPSVLTAQPHLANDLPYLTAVIKEALRLFPPASGIRQGHPTPL